jgi:general secretion pathway protein K
MKLIDRQQGVALITAILMVAIATVAAVAMATRQQLDIRRTGNLLHGTQAITYAEAAESWARVVLERDANKNQIDTLEDEWATQVPVSVVEGGSIRGRIFDMQARFNINSLLNQNGERSGPAVERFKILLQNLDIDQVLADYLVDFIDADVELGFPAGAEDNDYQLLQPGYRTANRLLVSVTELRLVKGFDAASIRKLIPYISALPENTQINVNTASAEVLRTLATNTGGSPGISLADAENLIEARGIKGYESTADFMAQPVVQANQSAISQAVISVSSNWFQMRAIANIGQAHAEMSSLIQRVQNKTSVVMRERLLHEPLQEDPES